MTQNVTNQPVAVSSSRGSTRVDHIFVSASVFDKCQQRNVLQVEGSDHMPLALSMHLAVAPAALTRLSSYTLPTTMQWRLRLANASAEAREEEPAATAWTQVVVVVGYSVDTSANNCDHTHFRDSNSETRAARTSTGTHA
jgi:hypothetical protein